MLGIFVAMTACSSGDDITPRNWTCQKLIGPVIAMSQERDVKILEITDVKELSNFPGSRLECRGKAEWSEGYGTIEFGAHVSAGGNLMLEYKRI